MSFGQFAGVDAHSSSWTLAYYEPHEGLSPRPLGLRHCVRRQCVNFSLRDGGSLDVFVVLLSFTLSFSSARRFLRAS